MDSKLGANALRSSAEAKISRYTIIIRDFNEILIRGTSFKRLDIISITVFSNRESRSVSETAKRERERVTEVVDGFRVNRLCDRLVYS